jgi:hypothetical protein
MRHDLYQILGVDPRSEIDQIKLAYRKLARRYHPDINPSPSAKVRMQEINQAYEVLGNPNKRAQYDQWRVLMRGSWPNYASRGSPRNARSQQQQRYERYQHPPPRCNTRGQQTSAPHCTRSGIRFKQRRRSRSGLPGWLIWLLIPAIINAFSTTISNYRKDIKPHLVVEDYASVNAKLVAASQWPIVLQEDFKLSTPNQWSTKRYTSDLVTIKKSIDGNYRWEAESHHCVNAWTHAPYVDRWSLKDFYVSVDCRRISGATDSAMGLVFRSYEGNLYILQVGRGQRFKVSLLKNDQWTMLIPWTHSDDIKQNEVNHLTVIGEGSHFLFFANNQYIGEVEDDQLSHGAVGVVINLFHANDHAIFEFDNFELRQPIAPSATKGQRTVTPTSINIHDLIMEQILR